VTGVQTCALPISSGDGASKNFTVPIIDNTQANPNKTINLALSSPTGGAYLNLQSSAVLTIMEDAREAWALEHFGTNANDPLVSGDLADPDNDGINNLYEYATASDPNAANPGDGTLGVIYAGNFQLIFHRNVSATDLTYVIKYSDSLTTWNDLMTYTSATSWLPNAPGAFATETFPQGTPPDSYATVTINDPTVFADPNTTTRFYRLAVHK